MIDVRPAPIRRRSRAARRTASLVALALLVLAAAVLSIAVGSRQLALPELLGAVFQPDGGEAASIVQGFRMPRTVLALAVGAALGIAGALMQGHTRNPLADPGLLGVSFGASFAVVIGIHVFGIADITGYAWLALLGAGLAAAAVFSIGSSRGGPDPITLVLAGSAVSALLSSATQAVVLRDTETLDAYRFWVVGSVAGRGFDVFWQVLPFLVAGLLLAVISAPGLNLVQLGDDVAISLGISPLRQKAMGIAAVMLLTGAATAACGPIGFVGLVVPHVARFLAGVDYRWIVPFAALIGGLLLLCADVIGRVIVPPGELQVGIVMALIGGPVFVFLVRRTRMVRL